jgi:cyclohexadieny/prephenate dehydrogenase
MADPMLAHCESPVFNRVCIIGLGLIGSSLARAIRQAHIARELVCYDANGAVQSRVEELGLTTHVCATLADAVTNADFIILCVPVGANAALAEEIASHLKPDAILSDVGSVKSSVVAAVSPHVPNGVHFVPAHPVAGTEQSGPDAGFATLFLGRWCILTPPTGTEKRAIDTTSAFWRACGSNVEIMTPAHHDQVLAITSHIPHLIAYNIVGTAAHLEEVTQSEVIKFSAGGFRDFTRIAASDPTMWRDVFLNNKEAVLEMLGRFTEDLTALQRMIRYGDGEGLHELFSHTRAIRRSIIALGQETTAPDFGRRDKPA